MPLINGPVEFGEYFTQKTKWTTEPTKLSQKGDLILCVRGSTTGRRVIADDIYALGRGVCSIRAYKGRQAFVNQTLAQQLDTLLTNTTGSVFPSLSSTDIRRFSVLIPPETIVDKFCRHTDPALRQIELNILESQKLAEIRDYLLPKLLSGAISVEAAAAAGVEQLTPP